MDDDRKVVALDFSVDGRYLACICGDDQHTVKVHYHKDSTIMVVIMYEIIIQRFALWSYKYLTVIAKVWEISGKAVYPSGGLFSLKSGPDEVSVIFASSLFP